jgi:hypothetical protein
MSKFLFVFALAATCAWAVVRFEEVPASKFQVDKQDQRMADNAEKLYESADTTVERWEHLDSAERGLRPNSFGETTVCSGMALTEHFAAHDLPLVRHGETGLLGEVLCSPGQGHYLCATADHVVSVGGDRNLMTMRDYCTTVPCSIKMDKLVNFEHADASHVVRCGAVGLTQTVRVRRSSD